MGRTSFFDNFLIGIFASFQDGASYFQGRVGGFFNRYFLNVSASEENRRLRAKILELEREIFEGEETVRENERLRAFLKFRVNDDSERVLARLVAWDADSNHRVIRISKGSKEGIKLQAPVVTSQGLVGYVYRLTSHFADILTIIDSNHRVDGLIQRIRSHGIVEGGSSSQMIMKYVSRTEPVILKDTVITSGLGNIYPKGIKIGTITRIEKESYGITQKIIITPAVNFNRLEEVVVLVEKRDKIKEKEWSALDKFENKNEKQRVKR